MSKVWTLESTLTAIPVTVWLTSTLQLLFQINAIVQKTHQTKNNNTPNDKDKSITNSSLTEDNKYQIHFLTSTTCTKTQYQKNRNDILYLNPIDTLDSKTKKNQVNTSKSCLVKKILFYSLIKPEKNWNLTDVMQILAQTDIAW